MPFFKDEHLSFKWIFGILILKCLGCLAYYGIYFSYYKGGFQGDSASTMQDAKVIYDALPNHPIDFLKMVCGFHSNLESDPLYESYFKYINKWGRDDATTEFFLNDNRMPIRINAIIMVFSFGKYAVHALVMLILSFIGQMAFYKTFKSYFPKKELGLAFIIFLTPSILFWTSGVLKEPISVCLVGLFIYSFFELFIYKKYKLKYVMVFIISSLVFIGLKPYILLLLLIPLLLFYIVERYRIKRIFIFYVVTLFISYSTCIVVLKYVFHKDVIRTIVVRQNDFVSLSKGGLFFLNDRNYLRLEYKDSNQYEKVDSTKGLCRIKPHAKLMYWDIYHLRDTIFVNDNKDTSLYKLCGINAPSGSGIAIDRLQYSFSSFAKLIPQSLFNVLCKPFFYDAHAYVEFIASVENLCFVLFFIFCFVFRKPMTEHRNFVCLCVFIVLLSFLLIGITTTVMGAIVRYKVPFIPFLLMIPLLYLDSSVLKRIPFINRFLK